MTNKIIIDGWNVIWKMSEIASLIPENLSLARKKFNLTVQNYFTNKKSVYKIIYDGQPGIVNSENVFKNHKVQFSKSPQNADQKILALLKSKKDINKWTLISSDKELTGRAKNLGAQITTSEEFIIKMEKNRIQNENDSKKSNPKLSKNEINNWLEIFNNQK